MVGAHERQPGHLLGVLDDDAVVDQPQPPKPGGGEHRVRLVEVDRARNRCETSRPSDHGVWYSSRPANRESSSAGAPEASIWS